MFKAGARRETMSTLGTFWLFLILEQESASSTPSLRPCSSSTTQNFVLYQIRFNWWKETYHIRVSFQWHRQGVTLYHVLDRDQRASRHTGVTEIMLSINHIESYFCFIFKLAEPIRYLLAYTETKCEYCDYVTGDRKSFLWTIPVVSRLPYSFRGVSRAGDVARQV